MQDANRSTGSRGDGQDKPTSKTKQKVPKGGSPSATIVPSPATASERVQPTTSTSRSSTGPVMSGGSNSRERRRGRRSPDSLAPLPSDTPLLSGIQEQDASAPSQRKKTRKEAKRRSQDTALTTTAEGSELTKPSLIPPQAGDPPSTVLVPTDISRSRKRRNNKKKNEEDAIASSAPPPPPPPAPTRQQGCNLSPQEFHSNSAASSQYKKKNKDATATSTPIPPQAGNLESMYSQRIPTVAVSASSQFSCSSSELGHTDSRGHAQFGSTPESQGDRQSQGSSGASQPKKRNRKKQIARDTVTTSAPFASLTSPASLVPPPVADPSSLGQADRESQGLLAASQAMKRMNKKKIVKEPAMSALVGALTIANLTPQQACGAPSPGSTSGSHMAGGSRLQPLQSECEENSTSTTSQQKKRKMEKKTMAVPCTSPSVHIPKKITVDTSSSEVIDSLKSKVLHFLDKCKGSSGVSEFYKSQIDQRTLVIDFSHLLYEDKELAFSVCNGDRNWSDLWLTSAAHEFFKSNGVAAERTNVHIVNLPDSIADAKDMLHSHALAILVKLFGGKEEAVPLTLHGQKLFDVIQCGLIDRLLKGDTWLGSLSIEDFMIVEEFGRLRAIITKPPAKKGDASPEEKALDVNSLWPMMEPFYVKDGVFPLYFEELKKDLTTATGNEVSQTWFMEYLRFHPAIMSSMARRNLVANAYHVARKYQIAHSSGFKKIFREKPMKKDWRKIARGHKVLLDTYSHRRPASSQKVNASQDVKEAGKVTEQQGSEVEVETEKVMNQGCGEMKVKAGKATEEGVIGIVADRSDKWEAEESVGIVGEDIADNIIEGNIKGEGGFAKWESDDGLKTNEEQIELELEEEIDMELKNDEDDDSDEDDDEDTDEDPNGLYKNTTDSLLIFKRHSLQHGDEKVKMKDLAELEFFDAKCFSGFLPFFLKRLLRGGKLGVKCKFEAVWSIYKASKGDKKDLACVPQSRRRLA